MSLIIFSEPSSRLSLCLRGAWVPVLTEPDLVVEEIRATSGRDKASPGASLCSKEEHLFILEKLEKAWRGGREVGLEKWVVSFIWLEMRSGGGTEPKVGIWWCGLFV